MKDITVKSYSFDLPDRLKKQGSLFLTVSLINSGLLAYVNYTYYSNGQLASNPLFVAGYLLSGLEVGASWLFSGAYYRFKIKFIVILGWFLYINLILLLLVSKPIYFRVIPSALLETAIWAAIGMAIFGWGLHLRRLIKEIIKDQS